MQSLFNNAHLPASIHFDTISIKRSLAESFLLFFSAAISFTDRRRPAFEREKKKKLFTVTLHFSFYVEDYSNSMIHLQGVFFSFSRLKDKSFCLVFPWFFTLFVSRLVFQSAGSQRLEQQGGLAAGNQWDFDPWLLPLALLVAVCDHKLGRPSLELEPDPIVTAEGERFERANLDVIRMKTIQRPLHCVKTHNALRQTQWSDRHSVLCYSPPPLRQPSHSPPCCPSTSGCVRQGCWRRWSTSSSGALPRWPPAHPLAAPAPDRLWHKGQRERQH